MAAWPSDQWWTAYGDPQLNDLIATALRGSPDVAAASARLDAARAQARAADAALGPQVNLNASVTEYKQSYVLGIPPQFVPHGFNSTGALTLNLNWDLDVWGRNRKLLAAATSEAQAASADAAQARLMLSTSIASSYATLAQLYADRDVAQRAVEVRTATFNLTSQRVTNGADTRAELSQAEAGPSEARADIAALDESIASTKNRIAALVGAGPDRGLAITQADDRGPARLRIAGKPRGQPGRAATGHRRRAPARRGDEQADRRGQGGLLSRHQSRGSRRRAVAAAEPAGQSGRGDRPDRPGDQLCRFSTAAG